MSTSGFVSMASDARSVNGSKVLIRGARQVVTLQGPARMRVGGELSEPGLLRDASILVEGGRIAQVGSARRLENLREAASARMVDARRLVVLPGAAGVTGNLLASPVNDGPLGESFAEPPPGMLSRVLTRELTRLALMGITYAQFPLVYPGEPVARSRMLRHLLRVDLPSAGFLAALRLDPLQVLAEAPGERPVREMIPPAARQDFAELRSLLSVQLSARVLSEYEPHLRFHVLRKCSREFRCQLTEARSLPVSGLLTLGVAAPYAAMGELPRNDADFGRLARWALPWILPAGESAFRGDSAVRRIRLAVAERMSLALATGFDAGRAGVASPLALIALLRAQTGLSASQLLHLTIANCAFALGVGGRMGTIEAGKEANLLLVECSDYREIGLHLGQPRIAAVFRRGVELTGSPSQAPR